MIEQKYYDVVVIGGSIGGTLAALSAAKEGRKVLLVEETKWLGGQLTSQAVPPDEHKYIEEFGCSATYKMFRNKIRQYYKEHFDLIDELQSSSCFDPGNSSVSRLAHDPRIALHLINDMVLPYTLDQKLDILLQHKAIDSKSNQTTVESITIQNLITNEFVQVSAHYFIDGTDTGDLLPMTDTEYVCGAESKEETGEPNALDIKDPMDMQPITWVAAVDYIEGGNFVIDRPASYDFWNQLNQPYDQYKVLSWYGPDSSTGKAKKFGMFDGENEGLFPLWSYRRIADPANHKDQRYKSEITLINWPQNDYFLGNIFDTDEAEANKQAAKDLTLSLIYWLQTEAPRPDGGVGYPGIRLRKDVLGTSDGLAQAPYIRESRRIQAMHTIKEHDISKKYADRIKTYKDSIGVGSYHIDLHITTKSNTFYFDNSWPFEIPLGALIPITKDNLIPGCKNIGTTHLTNGCFRLHPVEWNVGEVSGYLASKALEWNVTPREIYLNEKLLQDFQSFIVSKGIEIHWPEDLI